MSRRTVAPVLLFVAAAVSIAAVFAVQHIESGGGPFAEPWATPFFSPDGDGVQDTAQVRFTTKAEERITVRVVGADGDVVRTLAKDEPVDGKHVLTWDGTDDHGRVVAEGEYRIDITRAGDTRVYSPTRHTVVDVTPPIGRLDRATWVDGTLKGLALLEDGTRLEAFDAAGSRLEGLRAFRPSPTARSAQPVGPRIAGTHAVRFVVSLGRGEGPVEDVRIDAVDRAGNRTDLTADPSSADIVAKDHA